MRVAAGGANASSFRARRPANELSESPKWTCQMRPVLLSRSNDVQMFCVGVSVNRELGRMGAGAVCSLSTPWAATARYTGEIKPSAKPSEAQCLAIMAVRSLGVVGLTDRA